jgi:hypothetical protein
MKIVIVDSKEGNGGCLAAFMPESELWAFQVLCARAGQKVLSVSDEKDLWNKDFTLKREEVHAVTV